MVRQGSWAALAGLLAAAAILACSPAAAHHAPPRATIMDAAVPGGYGVVPGPALVVGDIIWTPVGGASSVGMMAYDTLLDKTAVYPTPEFPDFALWTWGVDGKFGYAFPGCTWETVPALGGEAQQCTARNDVWRFDPATKHWSPHGTLGDHWTYIRGASPLFWTGDQYPGTATWDGRRIVLVRPWSREACDSPYVNDVPAYTLDSDCAWQQNLLLYDPASGTVSESQHEIMRESDGLLDLGPGEPWTGLAQHPFRIGMGRIMLPTMAASTGDVAVLTYRSLDDQLAASPIPYPDGRRFALPVQSATATYLVAGRDAGSALVDAISAFDPAGISSSPFVDGLPVPPGALASASWGWANHHGYAIGVQGNRIMCFPSCSVGIPGFEALVGDCFERPFKFITWTHPVAAFLNWTWDFGDGTVAESPGPLVHAFTTTGVKHVTAESYTAGGEHSFHDMYFFIDVAPCPPVLEPPPLLVVPFGETAAYCAVAHPGMGGALSFALLGGPPGTQIDANTGCVAWTTDIAGFVSCIEIQVTEMPYATVATGCLMVDVLPIPGETILDRDGDGVGDSSDNCPATANRSQADHDDDGVGDACQHVLPTSSQTAPPTLPVGEQASAVACPSQPATGSLDAQDVDRDGAPDACDPDADGDGIRDIGPPGMLLDNCAARPNPDQADTDGDGRGDACSSPPASQAPSARSEDRAAAPSADPRGAVAAWVAAGSGFLLASGLVLPKLLRRR